jgi:hypothetical protein
MKMLEKRREDRYLSWETMIAELEEQAPPRRAPRRQSSIGRWLSGLVKPEGSGE